jgi:hypothetical protein
LPASIICSLSLRRRFAAASKLASVAPADDLARVDRAELVAPELRDRDALDRVEDFALVRDALEDERLAWLAPEVRFAPEVLLDRDVALEPPLLACGMSPSEKLDVGAHTIPSQRSHGNSRNRACEDGTVTPDVTHAIRSAHVDDAETIAGLLEELGYPTSARECRARLDRLLMRADAGVIVAELQREVVGVAAYLMMPLLERAHPQCRITTLVVRADQRRHGVAGALVAAVGRWRAQPTAVGSR